MGTRTASCSPKPGSQGFFPMARATAYRGRINELAEWCRLALVHHATRQTEGESVDTAETPELWVSSSATALVEWMAGSCRRGNRGSATQADEADVDLLLSDSKALAGEKTVEHWGTEFAARMAVLSDGEESSSLAPSNQELIDWTPYRAKDISTRLSTAAEINEDEAIEVAYEQLHKQLERDDEGLRAIDAFLGAVNVKRFTNAVLLSILTVTAMSDVRPRLSHRPAFYARTAEALKDREGGEAAGELLAGLE